MFGQNAQLLTPGLRLNIPLVHHLRKVDLREGMISVDDLHAYTKDNVPVTLSGSLFYQVHNSKQAVFGVQNLKSAVASLGTSAVRSIIGQFEYDEINADRNRINKTLGETIDKGTEKWGTACTKFEIQTVAPRNKHAEQQLELQMAAERKRRENDLNTSGIIRSAEGDKQSAILKSEGVLQAARNEADAAKYAAICRAEGERVRLDQETDAVMERLQKTATALGGDTSLAAQFWTEQKRIEGLSSIAKGPNNNSYVVPTHLFDAALRVLGDKK